MMLSFRKAALIIGAATMTTLAAGCTSTRAPYHPLSQSNPSRGGYSDVRLAANLYRVTFAGDRFASREDVEGYLLYRAAELTLAKGYDWFVIRDQETEREVRREVRRDPLYNPWFADDYGYWRPYWRYYGPRTGWRTWYPYYGDPFWRNRIDVRTVERFEVSAEIQMHHGAMPARNLRAFDARDIVARLGPSILPLTQ